ncbi:MAG: orotidine-5'-phosphate decarboxylase [Oligoflexales bacterium]
MSFRVKLEQSIEKKNSSLCIGIDPHQNSWPPLFEKIEQEQGRLKAISYWAHSTLEIAASRIPAVKFQSAMFESYGSEGFHLLHELCLKAKEYGFHVILDAKRADISSTMEAYGRSAFEIFQADSLTVLPYMGSDILVALAPWLRDGKGIYIVWISSNSSGQEVQLLETADKKTTAHRVLECFEARSAELSIENSFGLVLGATMLDILNEDLWKSAQTYPLLLPGLGAQGASPEHPKIKRLSELGSNLLPISRSLTGIGDKGTDLSGLTTLDEFQRALNSRISKYLRPLTVKPPY